MVLYNPLDRAYKSEVGAIKANKSVKFRVKGNFDSVLFAYREDESSCYNTVKMIKHEDYFECEIALKKGLYFYHFECSNGLFISCGKDLLGCLSGEVVDYQLLVYTNKFKVPEWINGGIIYQIFPDRFNRAEKIKNIDNDKVLHDNWTDTPNFLPNNKGRILNNDFFGGDLKGITEKLPYLKSLSVNAIYLNPIFKAYSNHRYDTGDYMQIDPLLGTEDDLIELIKKAKECGISIILDGVFNHTGADSIYFNKYGKYDSIGAYQSKNSPYYGWFRFFDFPDEYESWWGIDTLPDVNENNADYVNFITGPNGVIEHYTKLGVDGWRLDVADELPDKFIKKIREAIKGVNKDALLIGEVWEDASNKVAYGKRRKYFQGNELDSVMNYPLKKAILSFVLNGELKGLTQTIKEQLDHYPKACLDALMNILSTHDTFRLISALSDFNVWGKNKSELSRVKICNEDMCHVKNRVKMASLLQYTLMGVPSIYYGDEIGMEGYTDPLNRGCFRWDSLDNELLDWYKLLGKIRSEYSAFSKGEYEEVVASGGLFAFKRFDENSEVLVVVNNTCDNAVLKFNGTLKNLLDGKKARNSCSVKPFSFAIYVNDKKCVL